MARDFLPEQAIKNTMNWVVDTILIPHFMALGLNASGEWVANLKTRVEGNDGIISGRKYTEQLVWGRRPQEKTHKERMKWAYGMANFNDKFKNWLRIRGLEQYGVQIAYKLDKEGTQIYKDGGTDLLEILNTPETQQRIAVYMGQQMQAEVKLYLEREIQRV